MGEQRSTSSLQTDCPSPAPSVQPVHIATGSQAPPVDAWQHAAVASAPTLDALRGTLRAGTPGRPLRVSQLDAARLDADLTDLLREQFTGIFEVFRSGVHTSFVPELQAIVEGLIFLFSVGLNNQTPGGALLSLRYGVNSNKLTNREPKPLSAAHKLLLGVLTVGGRYTWASVGAMAVRRRWSEMDSNRWQNKIWTGMKVSENVLALLGALNLALFLRRGIYRSLVERLLGVRHVSSQPNMVHAISFEYMNRDLVWQEISEMVLFSLPLLSTLSPIMQDMWQRFTASLPASIAPSTNQESSGGAAVQHGCALCQSPTVRVPYKLDPCGHIFCYYCVRSRCLADNNELKCPLIGCKKLITAVAHHH